MSAPGPPALPLVTERLTLRLYDSEDADALLGYYADDEVSRYLLSPPWTRQEAQEQVAKRLERRHIGAPDEALALVVELGDRVIGDVALWPSDDTLSIGEIGWVFHPAFGGRGYATEAVRALVALALGHYRMHRVKAQLDPRNLPSARLCERLGMQQEAHLRQDWWSRGEWTDTAVYGVLMQEWPPGSP